MLGSTENRIATFRSASVITFTIIVIGRTALLFIGFIIIIDTCGVGRRHPPSCHESMEAGEYESMEA